MRNFMKPALILFIICMVVAAALSFTHSITAQIIEKRAADDAEASRRAVLDAADSFEKIDLENYAVPAGSQLEAVREAYKGLDGGKFCGYAFTVETKGYGGTIKVIVGVNSEGRTTGVRISESNETPGLGSKASEEPFISQLVGILPKGSLNVVKRESASDEEIEAISGATITSKAVVKAVQAAVDMSGELGRAEVYGKGDVK